MRRALLVVLLAAWVVPVHGIGIGVGLWADTLDISGAKSFVLSFLEDLGVPEQEVQGIEAEMARVPDLLPIPKPGGFLSIPLPVGAVELEGAMLSDALLRNLGVFPPDQIGLGEPDGPELLLDVDFIAYRLAVGWHIRYDVRFFAAGVGAGLAVTGGNVGLVLSSPDPEVQPLLPEIAPDAFRWTAGGPMLSADVEFGFPFLRLFARGSLFLPLLHTSGEAGLRAAALGGAAGLVLRF